MSGIFVFGSDVDFNTVIYCFMRAYHLPSIEGQELPVKDTWFIVPAVQHGPMITLVHQNIETAALMMIDSNGRTVKSHRVNLQTAPALSEFELEEIRKEAFDIPAWEKAKQEAFPYASMFDKTTMIQRFKDSGLTQQAIQSHESSNITYNTIRKKIKPQPCTTCGKKNR